MTCASELSRRYAAYLTAQLAGHDAETVDFGLWLDAHWQDFPAHPDEPCFGDLDGDHVPDNSVVWIEREREVIGRLAGRPRGCYRIPNDAVPPEVSLYLDDTEGCSTGSLRQERAFFHQHDREVLTATPDVARERLVPETPVSPAPSAMIPVSPLEISIESMFTGIAT